MQHVRVTFETADQDTKDLLTALLSEAGFEGFEEHEQHLLAYVNEAALVEDELRDAAATAGVKYTTEVVPVQNWNALWESNFQPVKVDDFCSIRAHFHDIVPAKYEIVITPKMSFGTGHHATTQLMIMLMRDIAFEGKSVLDFGTGTGVLAILAEMMGATDILAIDNDEWSVENAIENTERNECRGIRVEQGSLGVVLNVKKDIILANINRHILLHYMSGLYELVNTGGKLLLSGLLTEDREIILESAIGAGFRFSHLAEQANWIAILFEKI